MNHPGVSRAMRHTIFWELTQCENTTNKARKYAQYSPCHALRFVSVCFVKCVVATYSFSPSENKFTYYNSVS